MTTGSETTEIPTSAPQFYTLPELVRIMRMSYNGVYKMIKRGSIKAIKVGWIYRINVEEAQRIFNEGVAP
jgi:excisionase family DNA binding protein